MNHELQGSDLHGYGKKYEEAKEMIKDFFEVIDRIEENDSGTRVFYTLTWSSIRVMQAHHFGEVLEKMRKFAGVGPMPDVKKMQAELDKWDEEDESKGD